ncbi:ferredoxin--NADP reductase [Chitinophaga niabensis]|uniref:CDP-4-dehydro-6-deoxyglucose reductase n=1 Tax=Chitinophaga niabensis TaxID=536979 RepID=A0A1N6JEZ4_9BACT|nr:FAD-binding oxidoreductase [Chitinophaga niabensis]SIO42751.1 CDP-4-dehydro-6-deoxyglucose reductase [Chitinophaga niabensis]
MPEKWFTGVVTKIVEETYNTKRFWIRVPDRSSFDFKPGQFVTLDLPIHEKMNKRWRSYSIASHPNGTNEIELVIVLLEGGPGSTYLCTQVTEGTELTMRGPLGVFTLPEVLEKDLFFICTGTGIAPFRSMTHHLHNHGIAHPNIYLISGSRYEKDLLYKEEMMKLHAEMPGFQYIPTLSREDWSGRKGYVHAVYEELLADKRPANFFLCGWKAMIDEAKQKIVAMGYDRHDIHLELYG